eukprot:c16002_g1_i2.p1 GENE.c16002_g1_i2~~c16002_g1_i2.p1  ORF type:complete len:311 (-),score=58.29 c16002_g1_i2:13-945(-)
MGGRGDQNEAMSAIQVARSFKLQGDLNFLLNNASAALRAYNSALNVLTSPDVAKRENLEQIQSFVVSRAMSLSATRVALASIATHFPETAPDVDANSLLEAALEDAQSARSVELMADVHKQAANYHLRSSSRDLTWAYRHANAAVAGLERLVEFLNENEGNEPQIAELSWSLSEAYGLLSNVCVASRNPDHAALAIERSLVHLSKAQPAPHAKLLILKNALDTFKTIGDVARANVMLGDLWQAGLRRECVVCHDDISHDAEAAELELFTCVHVCHFACYRGWDPEKVQARVCPVCMELTPSLFHLDDDEE